MDLIRVVDVPVGSCADEAQRILNAPCTENSYLLVQVLTLPDGSLRAIYRLLARIPDRAEIIHARSYVRSSHSTAAIQQRIERVLRSKGPLGRAMLYKLTNGRRDGTVIWDKALQGLTRAKLVGQTEGKYFWAKAEE
jgi:hypothetical protein